MMPLKIKLNKELVKKEDAGPATGGQATTGAPAANGATFDRAPSLQIPLRTDSHAGTSIGTNATAPGGAPKTLKFKAPSGTIPGLTGQPIPKPKGPKSQSLKMKSGKRPAGGPASPGGAFFGAPGASGSGQPLKKIKLGKPGILKLKTTGTLNLAGAPIPPPLASSKLPPRPPKVVGPPVPAGPKKRGRKPKSDPDSLFQRQQRMVDEVTYKIASPPPRPHSLRHSASQGGFGEGTRSAGGSPFGSDALAGAASPDGAAPMEIVIQDVTPIFPPTPPTTDELARLLTKIGERDTKKLFADPVTEEVAPGYFSIISKPMDLSTMKTKLDQGAYASWEAFWEDLDLMFVNALTYNPPQDAVYTYASKMRKTASTMVTRVRTVNKGGGGANKKAAAASKKAAAAAKAERDAAARAARAEQKAAQEAKVLKKAGVVEEDLEARATYKNISASPYAALWGGLFGATNAQGTAVAYGRLILKPKNPAPSVQTYAASLSRFAENLVGRAKELVLGKLAAVNTAAEDVVPPEKPQAASGAAGGGGKRGRKSNLQKEQEAAAVAAAATKAAAPAAVPGGAASQFIQQPAPALGSLPPVAALTGVAPLTTAPAAALMQQTPAMAAANAQLLANQAQAQVAPGGVPAFPASIAAPGQAVQFIYPGATAGAIPPGMAMMPPTGTAGAVARPVYQQVPMQQMPPGQPIVFPQQPPRPM